jgi:thymidylate synthase
MKQIVKKLRDKLVNEGSVVRTTRWQGTTEPPAMVEILHISEKIQMLEDPKEISDAVNAKQPWANIHFKERTQGYPTNPDPSHIMWASTTDDYKSNDKIFSHTYSERLWPKPLYKGIRFDVGDLNTLVDLLAHEPDTRQAYMPMFMHEDVTAALKGERVPCSLGWHFIVRNGKLDIMYTMRSCDAMRHLHNDLYFANKLALWVRDEAKLNVKLGTLHFVATSLHCFQQDVAIYKKGLIK